MGKVILYVATSVDGRIATADGGVRWLDPFFDVDFGFHEFAAGMSSVILGRRTYDQIRGFGPEWPYKPTRSVVVSNSAPDDGAEKFGVEFYSGDLTKLRDDLVAEGDSWVIGGGELTRTFEDAGLIDEYMLFVMPTVLGDGVELFPAPFRSHDLQLKQAKPFENGTVLLHYERR